ncbi:MAG: metallophosphoesterase, partial [Candidatus Korarchaeota archaeon]|nr:metallophosphoesterase [Candidatus Korarchaeota archaeon]
MLAVSDVHAPVWLKDLENAVSRKQKGEYLILIAGDMVDRGNYKQYRRVVDVLEGLGDVRMVAVFGNDEYDSVKDAIGEENPEVTFLDDESIVLEVEGWRVGIVGSRGSLELPTTWQKRNIPGIEKIYSERLRVIGEMLRELREKVDVTVLLTHYATTTKTMKGENPRAWRYLGHRGFERYMKEGLVDVAVHG